MNNYSKFNDSKMYRNKFNEIREISVASEAVFALKKDEKIVHTFSVINCTPVEELRNLIDEKDIAIIEEVARSKFLTSLQIFEYVKLRGIDVKRPRLRKRILKLIKMRVLQENEMILQNKTRGVKYYELDIKGYQLAKEQGVMFNMGNRYLPFSRKKELGIQDDPHDVKRILVGNQIVLGLLLSNAKMERFGIMETMCIEAQELNGCIIRTAATVKIDSESVLAYEVVRDCPDAYIKLADKVQRYYKMLHNRSYLIGNHHGDTSYPQLVICGESLEHNLKIARYLQSEKLWSREDTILFTEDLLNMQDSLKSIYEIKENQEICWYRLPAESERL